jgi:DHA1 family bicyclomycin/chloramphenicol resistance-like MFS transporter
VTPLRGNAALIVMLGVLTAFGPLSIDLYLPGLPAIGRDFGVSSAYVQQTLSSFFIGLSLGQLAYGPLSDRFGRRPVMGFGIVLYLLATGYCIVAPGIEALVVGRFVQGLGGAAGPVVVRAAVRDVYAGSQAARALSFVILVMAIAPLVAPLFGGLILALVGWRGLFAAMLAYGLVCLAVNTFALPETHPPERRRGRRIGAMFAAYGQLLRNGLALGYLLCGGLAFGGLFGYVTGASFIYIDVFDIPPQLFGLYFAVNVVGLVIGNLANGRMVMRFGYRRMLSFGILVMWLGSLALLAGVTLFPERLLGVALPLFFAVGPIGVIGANTVAGLMDVMPENAGAASALFGVFQFGLGAAAGGVIGLLPTTAPMDVALILGGASTAALLVNVGLRIREMRAAEAGAIGGTSRGA